MIRKLLDGGKKKKKKNIGLYIAFFNNKVFEAH